jgi:phage terminase small subunit
MMPRKDPALHRLQGTRSQAKDSVSEDDSKQFTSGRLKMPPEIKADPKKLAIWKMLFSPLHRRNTLTRADSAAAQLLVERWILWQTVNAEAQARPFSESVWVDKNGDTHTKTVESAALKAAATLHRECMAGLKEFSATPASREKTRPTKTAPVAAGKEPTEAERLDEQIAALHEQAASEPQQSDEDLLTSIDEDEVTL